MLQSASTGGTPTPNSTNTRFRITNGGDAAINYYNDSIYTYGSGDYSGKLIVKADSTSDVAIACMNRNTSGSTGGNEAVSIAFVNEFVANQYNWLGKITMAPTDSWTGTASTRDADMLFSTNFDGIQSEKLRIKGNGKVGIGENDPSYELEIGGTANPKIAITSNINSATSSLYFGDSDAKDRGQIVYTHFGDFMELKTGGNTRVYLESGINTAYTSDGLYNANATPSYWAHGNAQFKLGYMDNGSGLYSGAYSFNVKSTDGIPVTGREIGAIYVRDTSNNRMPLIISNQGRININQTNTSTGLASTGWIDIQNGTSAYNFFNYYTGTDGSSGCARYRVDNTSP